MSEKTILDSVTIQGKTFNLYIPEEQIMEAVERLAAQVNKDYKDKSPVFVVVLNGAMFFAADLLRMITIPCELLTLRAKSYGNDLESGGDVEIDMAFPRIEGKDIILVEDIIDSGYTLQALIKKLKLMAPRSIEAVALLSKPMKRKINIDALYTGIEIPPDFVIGYGLDYAEKGRNLTSIYIMHDEHKD